MNTIHRLCFAYTIVCSYLYAYMCMCVHSCVCMYALICVLVCVYAYVPMYVRLHLCVSVLTCICVCVCVFVHRQCGEESWGRSLIQVKSKTTNRCNEMKLDKITFITFNFTVYYTPFTYFISTSPSFIYFFFFSIIHILIYVLFSSSLWTF